MIKMDLGGYLYPETGDEEEEADEIAEITPLLLIGMIFVFVAMIESGYLAKALS